MLLLAARTSGAGMVPPAGMGSPRSPGTALSTRLTLARREPLERFALEHFAFDKGKMRGGSPAPRSGGRGKTAFFHETTGRIM